MRKYKSLSQNVFQFQDYQLVPIRDNDMFDIMKWRNEQMYHLRQNKLLTIDDQKLYFENVIVSLFEEQQPNQILFSFLHNGSCIGYGGLVHINWLDKNAEISFVMNTEFELDCFSKFWHTFLHLIEQVAFDDLFLHKIYTYAFDLRPHLYDTLESFGYLREAILSEHCFFHNKYIDVLLHSKISNSRFFLKDAKENDVELYFKWVNDAEVRKNSINQEKISWENHINWFENKINNTNTKMFILSFGLINCGQIRIDKNEDSNDWTIDYSIDVKYRGKGFGKIILKLLLMCLPSNYKLTALVKKENIPSIKIFEFFGFQKTLENYEVIIFQKKI
jgi:RimJ/RimL family protein N-acetyltransferase